MCVRNIKSVKNIEASNILRWSLPWLTTDTKTNFLFKVDSIDSPDQILLGLGRILSSPDQISGPDRLLSGPDRLLSGNIVTDLGRMISGPDRIISCQDWIDRIRIYFKIKIAFMSVVSQCRSHLRAAGEVQLLETPPPLACDSVYSWRQQAS